MILSLVIFLLSFILTIIWAHHSKFLDCDSEDEYKCQQCSKFEKYNLNVSFFMFIEQYKVI